MKLVISSLCVLMLSGCSTFNFLAAPTSLDTCLTPQTNSIEKDAKGSSECELMPWIDYWLAVSQLSWAERQALLERLNDDPADQVKMVLLSNVPNTPYQSRLRAQIAGEQLVNSHSGKLADFIRYIIFYPAQKTLELESELSTQRQKNKALKKDLQAFKEKIAQQELQINKLLQIEKNIVEKPVQADEVDIEQ